VSWRRSRWAAGLAAVALAGGAALGACGGSEDAESAFGAGGTATPTGPITTVDLEVSGQGTVTIEGDPAEAPVECAASSACHAELHGALTLVAKAADGNVFLDYVDPTSGQVISNKLEHTLKAGTTTTLKAVFAPLAQQPDGGADGGGGGCTGDACSPTLATKLPSAAALVLSPTDVYFLGSIERVAKTGGTPTTLHGGAVSTFTIDEKYAYLIDGTGTSIKRVKLDGSETKDLGTADGQQHPQSIAVDDAHLYWTTRSADQHCAGVMRMWKDGSAPGEKLAEACDMSNTVAPFGIALDGSSVYFTTVVTPTFTQGTVWRAPKDASGVQATQLALGSSSASKPRVQGTTLYWMQDGIMKVDLDQCSPTCTATHAAKTQGVAAFTVDATTIFSVGDGGLVKVDKATLAETKLASEAGQSVEIDDAAIYWAGGAPGDAAIYKLAR
jgi:hypothetical protein